MTSQNHNSPRDIRESELYHEWYQRVASGSANDYVIAISAHPGYTGVSGSGKTTLGAGLAKDYLDHSPGGYDAESQYTVDVKEIPRLYDDSEELAVLIADEMQGTAATTNLNSKRSMKTEALEAYATLAGRRKERKTMILIVQTLDKTMKDMLDFVDAWLLIIDDYDYLARHYRVMPDTYDLESNKTRTPGVELLTWEPLRANDPDYRIMERRKDDANAGKRPGSNDEEDEDAEWGKEQQAILAHYVKNAYDIAWRDVESYDERLTYSGDYLRRVWKDVADENQNQQTAAG